MDQQFNFWQKWLLYANVMTLCVGLIVAFWGNGIIMDLHNSYTKDVYFNGQEFPPNVLLMKNWLWGIIGGTIVGFHTLMIFIIIYPFKNRERWSYVAMWTALMSWFIIDSSISWYFGAIHNVVIINLVALVLIGIPLVMTSKYFKPTTS